MAKFSSDFTGDAVTGFSIQSGVTGATSAGGLGAIANMASGVAKGFNALAEKKAEEAKLKDKQTLGGLADPFIGFEQEEAEFNANLADIETQMLNEKDSSRLMDLQKKYTSMVRAERTGAAGTIAARKRSALRQFIASNPHLASNAINLVQDIDGFTSLGDTGLGDDNPLMQEQAKMLQAAQSGITVGMQVQLAQQKFQADSLSTQVEMQTKMGQLAFPTLYASASADSLQLATEMEAMVGAIVDPTSPDFQGIDASTAKMLLQQNMDQMVAQKMQFYIGNATESGLTLTADQLNNLESKVRGNVMAAVEPYVQAMDQQDWLDRVKSIQQSKVDIANSTAVLDFQKSEPAMHRLQQIYGKEQAYSISKSVARINQVLADEVRSANLPTLLQSDPDLAFAYQVMQNEGLFSMTQQKLENPATPLHGNNALDAMATSGGVEALNDGALNMQGETAVLSAAMYGTSYNNTRNLLRDGYYNRLRTDVESQKALRNFTANETENVFGPMMDEIYQEGFQIKFSPIPPQRVKDGKAYMPAQAFTIVTDDPRGQSPSMKKLLNKLNTLYTLHGAFTDEAGLQTLGERLSGYVDTDSPKFIERHSQEQVNILTEQLKRVQTKLERSRARQAEGIGAGSIYDSAEERAANMENSIMASEAEVASLNLAIEAQRMRNPSYQLGLPAGSVLDQDASKAAGKTVYRLPDGTLVEAE